MLKFTAIPRQETRLSNRRPARSISNVDTCEPAIITTATSIEATSEEIDDPASLNIV